MPSVYVEALLLYRHTGPYDSALVYLNVLEDQVGGWATTTTAMVGGGGGGGAATTTTTTTTTNLSTTATTIVVVVWRCRWRCWTALWVSLASLHPNSITHELYLEYLQVRHRTCHTLGRVGRSRKDGGWWWS